MRRELFYGLAVGALLTAGLIWVLSGGAPFGASPPAGRAAAPAAPPRAETESHVATETAQGLPAVLERDAVLATLDKEALQQLITRSGQNAIKAAIARVGPAVVQVNVTRPAAARNALDELFRNDPMFDPFFRERPQEEVASLGSGFFIEYEGRVVVLTNHHVTEMASSIQLTTAQNWQFSARVLGTDAEIDVAVLEVDDFKGRTVPTVRLGDSDAVEIGDWVVAIGNPLGLSHTVTAGIISALGRNIPNPNTASRFRALIQTDAAINPGNSGGPLVNAAGEVVGINTLIATNAEGLNFAINANEVRRSLPALIRDGKLTRAWLGVYIQDLDETLAPRFNLPADARGVLVDDVVPGAPAAGVLRGGDVIVEVDGVGVTTVTELQDEIMFKDVGQTVQLTVLRAGRPATLTVPLGQRPSGERAGEAPQPAPQEDPATPRKFGLQVAPLDEALRQQLGLDEVAGGVAVLDVTPGSRADWAQLRAGDVIVAVNRRAIETLDDWLERVGGLDENAAVLFQVLRAGRTVFVALY